MAEKSKPAGIFLCEMSISESITGIHFESLFVEEHSFETKKITKQKHQSQQYEIHNKLQFLFA